MAKKRNRKNKMHTLPRFLLNQSDGEVIVESSQLYNGDMLTHASWDDNTHYFQEGFAHHTRTPTHTISLSSEIA